MRMVYWALTLAIFATIVYFQYGNSEKPLPETIVRNETRLIVYPVCGDGVVCYYYSYGMDCFRDKDLIEKYCGDE